MHDGPILPGSPIAKALAVVGDRWTVLVMREMFLGNTRFTDLANATGASRATLSKRLRALVANGVLYQNPYQDKPVRIEYRLTDKGFALYDFALSVWQWEYRWGERDGQRLPQRLRHRGCGHRFVPEPACAHCSEAIDIREISVRAGASATGETSLNQGALRRSSASLTGRSTAQGLVLHFVDVVADHWTPLVLAAAFMGLHRYDDIRRELGIATNILSHRLKLLLEAGVLQQPGGTTPAERRAYWLTEKGRALMIPALALHVWSLHWLPPGKGPSMEIHHACSTSPLQMHMRCSHCHAPLLATAVEF